MGGSVSTQIQKDVTDIYTSILMSHEQSCTAQALVTNRIVNQASGDIRDVTNKIDSAQRVSLKCVADIQNTSAIEERIKKELKQMAESKVEGLNLFQFAANTNIAESVDKVVQEVNIKTVQTQLAIAAGQNEIVNQAGGGIYDVNNTILSGQVVINDTVAKSVAKSSAVTELAKKIDQRSKIELAGLCSCGSLVSLIVLCVLMNGMSGSADDKDGSESTATVPPLPSWAPGWPAPPTKTAAFAPERSLPRMRPSNPYHSMPAPPIW
jgi:hypothetical protein